MIKRCLLVAAALGCSSAVEVDKFAEFGQDVCDDEAYGTFNTTAVPAFIAACFPEKGGVRQVSCAARDAPLALGLTTASVLAGLAMGARWKGFSRPQQACASALRVCAL